MILRRRRVKHVLFLLALCYVFFMLGNSVLSLTNPDEVFYSQTAREMMQKDSWMTPYLFGEPQFEKPIMTYWLLRLAFEAGGANPFSARFFPAFFAAIGIVAIYYLGLVGFKDERKALVSSVVMMSSGFYMGLARTVFTDMIFTVFILLSLLCFYWGYSLEKRRQAGWVLFFVFSALAVLTKGPLGLLIPLAVIAVFLGIRKEWRFLKGWGFVLGLAVFCLLALPWYLFMTKTYGTTFTHEFFYNDHWRRVVEAEHPGADSWYFYPLGAIGSLFPWSVFLVLGFAALLRRRMFREPFYLFLLLWVAAVFVIFQSAHSKLVSYIFPFFPALALVAGGWMADEEKTGHSRALRPAFMATGIFCLSLPVVSMAAPFVFQAYVTHPAPVFIFAGFLVVYLAVFFVLTYRRIFKASFWLLAALLPLLLGFSLAMSPHFQAFVSSAEAGRYLKENTPARGTILSSKFYARGIRYYTDREVAVIDINGKGYFSPHPVEYLNTEEKLHSFLSREPVTYAVLRKGYVKDLDRLLGGRFSHETLYVAGDEYIVRITPKDKI
ncbi:MAG: glycosyltransferase family 39 protein [Candidatus Omnitrophota bacterium]